MGQTRGHRKLECNRTCKWVHKHTCMARRLPACEPPLITFIQGTGITNFLTPHISAKCLYRGTPFAAAPAFETASDTARMALAPMFVLLGVPSTSFICVWTCANVWIKSGRWVGWHRTFLYGAHCMAGVGLKNMKRYYGSSRSFLFSYFRRNQTCWAWHAFINPHRSFRRYRKSQFYRDTNVKWFRWDANMEHY